MSYPRRAGPRNCAPLWVGALLFCFIDQLLVVEPFTQVRMEQNYIDPPTLLRLLDTEVDPKRKTAGVFCDARSKWPAAQSRPTLNT